MIARETVLDIVEPVAYAMPEYHVYAADTAEALDDGIASCGARAYASGLLLRHAFPNPNLYGIDFGFSPMHGGQYIGKQGEYIRMGHAVTRLWVPEQHPWVVESYTDSMIEVVPPKDVHDDFIWMDLHEGYREYLKRAGMGDVKVDPDKWLAILLEKS
jgi:hypothetical protein